MAGGAYSALSGLRTRMEQLDRIAADIANAATAGYKTERVPTAMAPRPDFDQVLQTAMDVSAAPGLIDFRQGSITGTGRDLDFAIEGRGFFEIETANGPRYTRNGQFNRRADGVLVTADGQVVRGDEGPIRVGSDAAIAVEADGTVRSGGAVAGRFRIVDVPDYVALRREEGARFRLDGAQTVTVAAERVRSGALEGSNVSMPERMVQLTEVARSFEALQRGVTTLMNDIDGRAISELGRR